MVLVVFVLSLNMREFPDILISPCLGEVRSDAKVPRLKLDVEAVGVNVFFAVMVWASPSVSNVSVADMFGMLRPWDVVWFALMVRTAFVLIPLKRKPIAFEVDELAPEILVVVSVNILLLSCWIKLVVTTV